VRFYAQLKYRVLELTKVLRLISFCFKALGEDLKKALNAPDLTQSSKDISDQVTRGAKDVGNKVSAGRSTEGILCARVDYHKCAEVVDKLDLIRTGVLLAERSPFPSPFYLFFFLGGGGGLFPGGTIKDLWG
jgi:hypothetical protein